MPIEKGVVENLISRLETGDLAGRAKEQRDLDAPFDVQAWRRDVTGQVSPIDRSAAMRS